MARKFRKGDRVVVLSGRDKGKEGDLISVDPSCGRGIVKNVNVVQRHQRATGTREGGIHSKESSIHLSNLGHIDPKDGKPTRVGFRFLEDGRKIRFSKRSGEVIDV